MLLRLSQVAERLNCSLQNVYSLKDSGALPVISVGANGKGYRVREEDLLAFIENGRHGRRPQEWPDTNPHRLKHIIDRRLS